MTKNDCHICNGTGFHDGKICICITGKKDDKMPEIPDALKDIFGDIFGGQNDQQK